MPVVHPAVVGARQASDGTKWKHSYVQTDDGEQTFGVLDLEPQTSDGKCKLPGHFKEFDLLNGYYCYAITLLTIDFRISIFRAFGSFGRELRA